MHKERIFYFAVIVICIICAWYFYSSTDSNYEDIYNDRIQKLNSKIDSLHSENYSLENEVDSLNSSLKELNVEISKQDSAISKLNKETDEKINSVNYFSNSELAKFFAERYGYSLNSTSQ